MRFRWRRFTVATVVAAGMAAALLVKSPTALHGTFDGSAEQGRLQTLCVADDGNKVAVLRRMPVRRLWSQVWEYADGSATLVPPHTSWNEVSQLCYADSGDLFALGRGEQGWQFAELRTGEKQRHRNSDDFVAANAPPAFVLDAVPGRITATNLVSGEASVFTFPEDVIDIRLAFGRLSPGTFALSYDGKFFVSKVTDPFKVAVFEAQASDYRYVRIPTNSPMGSIPAHLALSPDGRWLAWSYFRGPRTVPKFLSWFLGPEPSYELAIIDVLTGEPRATFPGFTLAEFSSNGKFLAIATEEGAIRVYDFPLRIPWRRILLWSFVTFLAVCLLQQLLAFARSKLRTET